MIVTAELAALPATVETLEGGGFFFLRDVPGVTSLVVVALLRFLFFVFSFSFCCMSSRRVTLDLLCEDLGVVEGLEVDLCGVDMGNGCGC